jgi:glyoxylase-like metal-dependent hydrolase (beta-lactamase superfamily II)
LSGTAVVRPSLGAQAALAGRFHDIRRGVGVFTGPGGTIGWLATPDGAVAIDSQFPDTARACVSGLQARSSRGVEVLINTHHHADHTAGNVTFRPVVRQIVQHERCAAAHRNAAQNAGADALKGLADVTFGESWSTMIGSERVTVSYFGPAHTSGDAVVLFEAANVVHVGDLVFNRVPPFVDRAAGASIRNWVAVLGRVATTYRGATFIFGHGKDDAVTGTVTDVTGFADYLAAVLDYVQKGIVEGRSEQEITSLETLPGFPEYADLVKNYASAFPLFTLAHVLSAAYQELSAQAAAPR